MPGLLLVIVLLGGTVFLSADSSRLARIFRARGLPAEGKFAVAPTEGAAAAAARCAVGSRDERGGAPAAGVGGRAPGGDARGGAAGAGYDGSGVVASAPIAPVGPEGRQGADDVVGRGAGGVDAADRPAGGEVQVDAACGWISVETIGPPGKVKVYVDGELAGSAPLVAGGIVEGTHTLRFAPAGGAGWDERVRVVRGDTTVVAFLSSCGGGSGRLVIKPAALDAGARAARDSVLVDGVFAGRGELSVEVPPGYHCVSFLREGMQRRDFVLHVQAGSIQYISPPEGAVPFSIEGRAETRPGGSVRFEARLKGKRLGPSELTLVIVPHDDSAPVTVRMPRLAGRSYSGSLSSSVLGEGEIKYFFRAELSSGLEVHSPVYTLRRRGA